MSGCGKTGEASGTAAAETTEEELRPTGPVPLQKQTEEPVSEPESGPNAFPSPGGSTEVLIGEAPVNSGTGPYSSGPTSAETKETETDRREQVPGGEVSVVDRVISEFLQKVVIVGQGPESTVTTSDDAPGGDEMIPPDDTRLEKTADPVTIQADNENPALVQNCLIEGDSVVISGQYRSLLAEVRELRPDPDELYLFEFEPYETSIYRKSPTESIRISPSFRISLPLTQDGTRDRLYRRFAFYILQKNRYTRVSEDFYITNPESAAGITTMYCHPDTKKGLLVEFTQIQDAMNLGVGSVIINIPFNEIAGEGIEYRMDGKVYSFDKEKINAYDRMISTYSNKNLNVYAVLLNGWSQHNPNLYGPGTRQRKGVHYYHFNTATKEGCQDVLATISFLADRYSGRDRNYGRIQNWIIGNEVNNQAWNYLGEMSIDGYVSEYEKTFRLFYTAIRSTASGTRVFFSLDNNWMNLADGRLRYNAKEFLDRFAAGVRKHGNIDWCLAYHPYNEPSTEPEFWNDMDSGLLNWTNSSPIINFCNLSVLTDYMQRGELRDRRGNIRTISLTEEGFTSVSPTRGNVEELQAAAFAYAYYIADSNPYIDTFILSRQVDAPSERRNYLAMGLWTTKDNVDFNIRPAQRKYIWNVFKNIDRQHRTLETTQFARKILGIDRWSDVIPGFRWKKLEQ